MSDEYSYNHADKKHWPKNKWRNSMKAINKTLAPCKDGLEVDY